jgi:hypothetical protein
MGEDRGEGEYFLIREIVFIIHFCVLSHFLPPPFNSLPPVEGKLKDISHPS